MNPTPFPEVNAVIDTILARLRAVLGDKLVGLYLFGSLVSGEFDERASDIDLIALAAGDLSAAELDRLKRLHDRVADLHPRWANRIEVIYASVAAAGDYRRAHHIAIISPGEPFHVKRAESDWLINRHLAREQGKALFGPPLATLLPSVPCEVMRENIRNNARDWRVWITQTELIHQRTYQGHMIVTMCRELYRFRHGGAIASKREASRWAMGALPAWAALIRQALVWRLEEGDGEWIDHDAMLEETLRFVNVVLDTILKE